MNFEFNILTEISQSQKHKCCMRYIIKYIGTERILVVARGRGEWELLFNGYGVSILEDEKSYKDGWW